MVDSLAPDVATLVGLILQSLFYGIYQVLFLGCLYVLVYLRASRHLNWQMLGTSCVMWLLITLNFALSWSRVMDAFIVGQSALREDPKAIAKYFVDLGLWKEVTRTGVYLGLTVVADSLFIYRCYVVWSRSKYIIALPIFLLFCSVISGMGIEILLGTTGSTTPLFSTALAIWSTTFFSISLLQNLLVTFLICYRIWRVNIDVSGLGLGRTHSLWPVMTVILESGAIYSSTLFALLVTYASGTFAVYIVLDMLVPIIGIVFSLIIVRVGLGVSQTIGRRHASSTAPEPSAVRFRTVLNSMHLSRNVTVEEHINMTVGPTSMMTKDTPDDLPETVEDAQKLLANKV